MAESQSMTTDEVVARLLARITSDVLRESLRWVVQPMMEAEISDLIGAGHGERTPDRATHRNGYRRRRWDTRAGEIELQIPKLRQSSYFPSFLEPRRRSEQALLNVVRQAYVCGVSTRKVDQLVESPGLRMSRSEVSRISAGLDEQVEAFRTRPLEGRYLYLYLYPWFDAKVEKVRDGGQAARKCPVIVSERAMRSTASAATASPTCPGAVPITSTRALTNATLRYVLRFADGVEEALRADPGFLGGLSVRAGLLTDEAVVHDQGREWDGERDASQPIILLRACWSVSWGRDDAGLWFVEVVGDRWFLGLAGVVASKVAFA